MSFQKILLSKPSLRSGRNDTFEGDSALFTWIYRIGINLAKNTFNSKSLRNDGITDNFENIESLIAANESPEAFTISMSLKAELDNFLRELPIDLKTVFLLREDEGKSYEQIDNHQWIVL